MTARLERLRERLEEPLLVTKPANVRYLTGLDSSNAALLVEQDATRLFTDFRYVEKARGLGLEVVELPRNLFAELSTHLRQRVGFEAEHLPYAAWEALQPGGAELVPRREVVEDLRAVKEDEELDAIRRAARITTETFERLAEQPFVGRPERELAWWIESTMRELGADGAAFPVIVAAGAGGAEPHASTSDRPIPPDTLVVVDAAAKFAGYCSDCTRTFATGPLPEELERAYGVCLHAQRGVLAAVLPGARGDAVDAVARAAIETAGFGERFGHGLGHGVGLEIQELPRLRPESEDVLARANVVTVEPGIYLPGLGGVRIEDLVVVGDSGPEILTGFTKELVTVR